MRPENYDKIFSNLQELVSNLKLEVLRLEEAAHDITALPSPEIIMPAGGTASLIDFIKSDHRRPIFLILHDRRSGRVIHATKSPALDSTLLEPHEIIGRDLRDCFVGDIDYKHAKRRIWLASNDGYHRTALCIRRNMMENKVDMRMYVAPGEKNLIVNFSLITGHRMTPCHLSQAIERFDFSAAHDFYTHTQSHDMGDRIQEIC